jgi:tol-pal system protein YbgF
MMTRVSSRAIATAALAAAVVASVAPAHAQRLSLAERVDRLEQQQQSGAQPGSAVDLVNQISSLQSQVQMLQGKVEELQHALDQARQQNKDQYVDLDSRLGRIEGRAPGAAPAAPGAAAAATSQQPPDIELGGPSTPAVPAAPATPPPAAAGDLTDADRAAMPPDAAAAPAVAGDPADESAAYGEAFQALKDGRYAESARRFQAFIDRYPDGSLTGNAYYWLGESYYVTQNYEIAEQSFRTLLQRYPDSQKAPDALLKTGYAQYELKQWDQAEATLNQVVQQYPDTTVARLAEGRLRALKLEARR